MNYLNDLCCVCLSRQKILYHLSNSDNEGSSYYLKLTSCVPEMNFKEILNQTMICQDCCSILDTVYKFRQKCLSNKIKLIEYVTRLTVNGRTCVRTPHSSDIKKENSSDMYNSEENCDSFKDRVQNGDNGMVSNTCTENGYESFYNENVTENSVTFEKVNVKTEPVDTEENLYEEPLNCNVQVKFEQIDREYQNDPSPETRIDNTVQNGNIGEDQHYSEEPAYGAGEYRTFHLEENQFENNVSPENLYNGNTVYSPETLEFNTKKENITRNYCRTIPYKYEIANSNLANGSYSYLGYSTMQFHHPEKSYVCTICNKKCTQLAYLTSHMRSHTGERPFACEICNKKFSQAGNLASHLRIHTGERPYVCQVCNKTFSQSSNLTKHKLIHTGEKTHVCRICDRKFNQSSNLIKHMRIHTGERPYECSVCKKSFNQSCNLMSHLRTHSEEKLFEGQLQVGAQPVEMMN